MEITEEGKMVVEYLNDYFNVYSDDHQMAQQIREIYNLKEVHVIPGNCDTTETVKAEMGRQAGQLLEGILYEDAIVSVTGGSTMARVSEAMHLLPFNVFFVPARGGLGENMVYQANTISASMAQQTGGYYTSLYVPDNERNNL